ncbi:MAG TPA: hypothetical protein GX745_03540 [Clostridiales bacterium]|nr:hypothetical protein [Clostridiales bacterium]
MRMGKKMRIISILMSITVIAATLGFATFALTQNNSALDYDGTLIISGNADVDVKIEFVECTGGTEIVQFSITADEKGIIEKQGDTIVKSVVDVQDLTNYSIFTKPVLNPVNDYKFVITISNPNVAAGGTAYADAYVEAVSFASSQAFKDYYTIMNPNVNDDLLKAGESLTYIVLLDNKPQADLDYNNAEFTYSLNIVAKKLEA